MNHAHSHRLPPTRVARQRGASAVLLLLLITGMTALALFASDGSRVTADAAQLKRATDAAALAAAIARAQDPRLDVQQLAERYVLTNLGLDDEQLSRNLVVTTNVIRQNDADGVRVTATFRAEPMLGGAAPQDVRVASAAIARQASLEVSLVLPNSHAITNPELAVLRRLGKKFARDLLGDVPDPQRKIWLSIVPYAGAVNVYDESHPTRINTWARPGAIRPPELRSLFSTGYSGLADARMPDRRAKLLCMYRGMVVGQNYFWEQPAPGQFGIYYRHDLPVNVIPETAPFTPISWRGPNPDIFGQRDASAVDTRFIVADKACPAAPVLPLTQQLGSIDARLDQMSTRWVGNYAIALGWGAMALSPGLRGSSGWGNADLPRDFGPNAIKAVVMLANPADNSGIDSDSYNFGGPTDEARDQLRQGDNANTRLQTQRILSLCSSFRAQDMKFHFISVHPTGDPSSGNPSDDTGSHELWRQRFEQIMSPGFSICAAEGGSVNFSISTSFSAGEELIEKQLENIVKKLKEQSSFARLVE